MLNAEQRAAIYARDGYVCQYCGNSEASSYAIDHIIPRAGNGSDEPYNLAVACEAFIEQIGEGDE